ncbi:MAG: hypothetical protein OEZ06_22895 [Myxococcales bacterium]|nr:hypothetical protein [Myxococcales bacterium]
MPEARAQTQAAEAEQPRRLATGAPVRHLPVAGKPKTPKQAPRGKLAPSVTLGAAERGIVLQKRGEKLLEREIAVLRRLVANLSHRDRRRADALLRLSQAYFDKIWNQRQRLHRLREARQDHCDCEGERRVGGDGLGHGYAATASDSTGR